MPELKITVNGVAHRLEIEEGRVTLADVLRDRLDLTGTKVGCGVGRCGACTVILNGEPATSCTVLAGKADGAEVLTVEGVAEQGRLHPVQEAFVESGAVQCGFCTPGLVMRIHHLLSANPDPGEKEVTAALAKHLCRCTGYEAILEAVKIAREKMKKSG